MWLYCEISNDHFNERYKIHFAFSAVLSICFSAAAIVTKPVHETATVSHFLAENLFTTRITLKSSMFHMQITHFNEQYSRKRKKYINNNEEKAWKK